MYEGFHISKDTKDLLCWAGAYLLVGLGWVSPVIMMLLGVI